MSLETAFDIIVCGIIFIFLVGLVTTVNFVAGLAGLDLSGSPDVDASDFENGTLEYTFSEVEHPDKGIVVEPIDRKEGINGDPEEVLVYHRQSDTYESFEPVATITGYDEQEFNLGCGEYKIIEKDPYDVDGVDLPPEIVVEEVSVPCADSTEDSREAGEEDE
ncbi:hypothetical protein JMJ58_03635 [Haloterrigena salifodinae]|uniref:Uncharacterized protein n=1 Tax=Haloterrigena salifodinae TaxID=2675099 RepID=A0A8T8E3F0_9EURY|nr:hypothetical protein [Haloterrigena salifodinae]QRV16000.1 hypothetical protein JMJ58_03635 [Haloterrigena salifodinae]